MIVTPDELLRVPARPVERVIDTTTAKPRIMIGRGDDSDLRLESDFVSRHHALLFCSPWECYIEDLNSFNGTLINGKAVTRFSADALARMRNYAWPGNVRELENTVEYAVALATQNIISEDAILPDQTAAEGGLQSLKDAKEEFEKNYLIQLIELTHGNVSQAAKLAGKYRADLYQLLKKYDIKAADYRRPPR